MILTLQQLQERALERPKGYLDEVISQGTLSDDGQTLDISREALAALREKYRPSPEWDKSQCGCCGDRHSNQ